METAVRYAIDKDSQAVPVRESVKIPVFDCGGPALVNLADKDAIWEILDADS